MTAPASTSPETPPESFREIHARLDSQQRQQLAARARVDTGLLALAARSRDTAGWLQDRIADGMGEPRTELFPRSRRDADRERHHHRDTADRPESWLRHARQAVDHGDRS